MLLLVVVLGPVAEELLFRGVLYPGLRNELGPWAAVPLSGLIFGFFHRYAGWPAVVGTAVFGMGFALLAEGSGSLWPGMVAHILGNANYATAYLRVFRMPVDPPPSVEPSAAGLAEPSAASDPARDSGPGGS
jgi:membrane protease YdiL (CAAX protease family)